MKEQDRGRIAHLLAALPVELRETLVLRELEEMSYKEIARGHRERRSAPSCRACGARGACWLRRRTAEGMRDDDRGELQDGVAGPGRFRRRAGRGAGGGDGDASGRAGGVRGGLMPSWRPATRCATAISIGPRPRRCAGCSPRGRRRGRPRRPDWDRVVRRPAANLAFARRSPRCSRSYPLAGTAGHDRPGGREPVRACNPASRGCRLHRPAHGEAVV